MPPCLETGNTEGINAMTNNPAPRAWVGCLACHVDGYLVGDWFEAAQSPTDADQFEQAGLSLPARHFAEGHDEVWVFDFDGFGGVLRTECAPSEAVRLAELISAANDRGIPPEVLAYWINDGHDTHDPQMMLDELQDAWCGHYETEADYARQLADDLSMITETDAWPYACVDWEWAWRELNLGGDNYSREAPSGGYHIFRAI